MKIIYLDQNKWIDLLKSIEKPDEYSNYVNVAKLIKDKADSGEWIFPLSLVHFTETLSRADTNSREKLANVMTSISKNWSIKSCIDVQENEFLNSFSELHDTNKKFEIQAVRKNLLSAIGVEYVEVKIKNNSSVSESIAQDLKEFSDNLYNSEELFSLIMAYTNDAELIAKFRRDGQDSKKEWENLQKKFSKLPKEYSYRIFLIDSFLYEFTKVNKKLLSFFEKTREEIFPIELLNDKDRTIIFLESIPSLNVRIKLLYEILRNPQRPIHEHDCSDLIFLSTAIPYCDVVITERTWRHSAKLHKLDSKYSTLIENDLNYLLTL